MYVIYWGTGVLLEGDFSVVMSFFLICISLQYIISIFSVMKIFALAKGNLFYEICYVP